MSSSEFIDYHQVLNTIASANLPSKANCHFSLS
jgi:hypothetical protein